MERKATTNTFPNGMLLDQNPMTMPNTALSGALNATLVTRDGNELILQLDKGNGRVETAYLPEGFVPIGTVEFGGIIYIASYNPLTNRSQIGCFPSPERNITSDELSECGNTIDNSSFIESEKEYINSCLPTSAEKLEDDSKQMTSIKNKSIKLKVLTGTDGDIYKLNPGDRYKIFVSNDGALEANAGTISDIYSDDDNVVDETPRYLTIRMISLPEDGKIVYLDKNLKWDWDGNKYGYYISGDYKTNEGGTSIDLDSYRSLVSSAYNVFNSKISGELGLLFDLKIVNSITITWDADIYDYDAALVPKPYDGESDDDEPDEDESEYRWATIRFYVNYESDSPRINLYRMIVTGSYLSVNGDRDEINNGCPFGLALKFDKETFDPAVIDDDSLNSEPDRKNDGTDEDLECDTYLFKYDISKLVDTIWNYELTPAMWFGNIDWLAIKGSINFKLLGSGVIDLIEWRYYVSATSLTLSWALEAYPEKNKKIFSVEIQFYDSDAIAEYYDRLDQDEEKDSDEENTPNALEDIGYTDHLLIEDKKSYSGYFQNIFVFDDTNLERDKLYLVKLIVKYGTEADGSDEATDRIYLRWLYTTGQWNDEYLDAKGEQDFKNLELQSALAFSAKYDVTYRIGSYITEGATPVIIPDTSVGTDEYSMLGANVTTVSYEDGGFNTNNVGFAVDADIVTNNLLFSVNINNPKFALKAGKVTTTAKVLYYGNEDTEYGEFVEPLVMENTEPDNDGNLTGMPKDPADIVANVRTAHMDQKVYESAIDSFNALLVWTSGSHFDVNVQGMIFSKINAPLVAKECTIGMVLKPMLYRKEDLNELNLRISDEDEYDDKVLVDIINDNAIDASRTKILFTSFYTLWAKNSGGSDTELRMHKINNAKIEDSPSNAIEIHMAKHDDWVLGDWSEGDEYNKIVEAFNALGGPLQVTMHIGDDRSSQSTATSYRAWNSRIARFREAPNSASAKEWFMHIMSFEFWLKNLSSNEWLPLNFFVRKVFDPESAGNIWRENNSYISAMLNYCFAMNNIPAGIAASIYNSIYKFVTPNKDDQIIKYRVDNICWLGNQYDETWEIDVGFTSTFSNDNIYVSAYSLSTLQKCYEKIRTAFEIEEESNEDAGLLNINYKEATTSLDDAVLTHVFHLYNTGMYNKYYNEMATNIPYAAYYDNSVGISLITDVNEDVLYVRTGDTFSPLSETSALNIYLSKQLSIKGYGEVANYYIVCTEYGHLLGNCEGAKVLSLLEPTSDGIKASSKIDNQSITSMYFVTHDSKMSKYEGNDTAIVKKCSSLNFGVNYDDVDGTFNMDLGGDTLES